MASRTTRRSRASKMPSGARPFGRLPISELDPFARWCRSVLDECEADIATAMGLVSRECSAPLWRAVRFAPTIDLDGALSDSLQLTDGPLKQWIARTDPSHSLPETRAALWSAALAMVTDRIQTAKSPIDAFTLGRLWEWCFQLRHEALLMTKLRGSRIKNGHDDSFPDRAALHAELREYARDARQRGRSRRWAAKRILGDNGLVVRMRAAAGRVYSESHLINNVLAGI